MTRSLALWLGLAIGCGAGAATATADAADGPLTHTTGVPLWGRFETTVTNGRKYANPFTDVTLHATFIRPDRSRVSFIGFHDGDGK